MFLWLSFCRAPSSEGTQKPGDTAENRGHLPWKKPASGFHDSLIIQSFSAVFFQPDSLQRERIREVLSKNVFSSVQHDCYFQMRNARLVMQRYWPQIRIVEVDTIRYLVFVKKNGFRRTIDLNQVEDVCGIYLFDGDKDPVQTDMPNIDSQLGFYFRKK
jgi:hypothetical protein